MDAKCCSNCGLEFSITKDTDIEIFQEEHLIRRFTDEALGKVNEINYYETAINILKAHLTSVVTHRSETYCSFYRVMEQEITCFLFRVANKTRFNRVKIEFDTKQRYPGIVPYSEAYRKMKNLPRIKSYMVTNNFEEMMETCKAIFRSKSKQYGPGKTDNSKFFIYKTQKQKNKLANKEYCRGYRAGRNDKAGSGNGTSEQNTDAQL
jgi:hypothetical protein